MVVVRRLIWDPWNVAHIARHGVMPEEVEDVCRRDPIVERGYGGRLRLIGMTGGGRALAAILAPQGRGIFYPVTARPASVKERRLLAQER